jgi:hypothetical protein
VSGRLKHAESKTGGEEQLGKKVSEIPRATGSSRKQNEQLKRIGTHGKTLTEKRQSTGVVSIPKREFSIF